MGRFSSRLAPVFADFAGVEPGMRALDVGAGTGALTAELVRRDAAAGAIEPSPAFVATLRSRYPGVDVREGGAEELPWPDDSFDVALAQLVVAFMSDAPAAIAEMVRVARRVAVCMWGVAEVDMFRAIERTTETIGMARAAEPRRYRTPEEIHDLLAPHGDVESAELDVTAGYRDFDEFWRAMDRGVGPAGQWLASLEGDQRQRAYDELSRELGSPQGPFELKARAFAAAVTPA